MMMMEVWALQFWECAGIGAKSHVMLTVGTCCCSCTVASHSPLTGADCDGVAPSCGSFGGWAVRTVSGSLCQVRMLAVLA